MAQTKVIKTGRTIDKWLRLLTYLQSGGASVYRLTFPSTDLARKAAHSFRELTERQGYFRVAIAHRGAICYVFKTEAVQDVKVLDE